MPEPMPIYMWPEESGGRGPSLFYLAFPDSTRCCGPGTGGLRRIGNVYLDTVNTEAAAHDLCLRCKDINIKGRNNSSGL